MDQDLKNLLPRQLETMKAATAVLHESSTRVSSILGSQKEVLSIEEKESCEALTARFARLCDFLFQRLFRTLDRIELVDEGTNIDRLNRMEKRGLISSAELWKRLRDLRNDIAHEYLIDKSDRVLKQAFEQASELFLTAKRIQAYVILKKYV